MSELRMTYQSQFGDYGWAEPFDLNSRHRIANRLGAYEDIGTPEQFRALRDRFMAEQAEAPLPLDLSMSVWVGEDPAAEAAGRREAEQWNK